MKTRIAVWTVVAILVLFGGRILLALHGIRFGPAPSLAAMVPLVFLAALVAVHCGIGIAVWCDAKRRPDLLLGIPAWTWGLLGLATGVIGLGIHWLANCCQFVKNQTVRIDDTTTEQRALGK